MDTNRYELFADIAETKNFTRSGERMGYTQPGVSHIIRTLEAELGFSLFIRTRTGLSLTAEAERLLPHVHELLASVQRLNQVIDSLRDLPPTELTIASYCSISRIMLPGWIRQLRELCPNMEINLMEGGPDEICRWLEEGSVDLGLLSRRGLLSDMEWIPLTEDPMMAVLPKDIPLLSDTAPVKPELLTTRPFIISSLESNYDLNFVISDSQITPDILYSSQDDLAIAHMVENSIGVSILPRLVLDGCTADVRALPMEPAYSRELGIAYRSSDRLSAAASLFISVAGVDPPLNSETPRRS